MAFKPEGYNSASPYLIVKDARRTIAFLEAAFDGELMRSFPTNTGGIMHAEVKVDDTVIMMGEGDETEKSGVHVYVLDADATFKRAVAAGGTVIQEVIAKGDGDRRGGVADPNGIIWWMATQE
jgi:uncharacterized glyoxalase superfamily protein PhnB